MAKGSNTDEQTIRNILAAYVTTNNCSEVSRQLGVPVRTVNKIVNENINKPEYAKLCQEKKEEFSSKASKIIDKQLELLSRRVDTALEHQEELEELIYEVWSADKEEIKEAQKKSIATRISKLQLNSLSEITTSMGTLYDKMRLDKGESTENTNQTINIAFSEDIEELSK